VTIPSINADIGLSPTDELQIADIAKLGLKAMRDQDGAVSMVDRRYFVVPIYQGMGLLIPNGQYKNRPRSFPPQLQDEDVRQIQYYWEYTMKKNAKRIVGSTISIPDIAELCIGYKRDHQFEVKRCPSYVRLLANSKGVLSRKNPHKFYIPIGVIYHKHGAFHLCIIIYEKTSDGKKVRKTTTKKVGDISSDSSSSDDDQKSASMKDVKSDDDTDSDDKPLSLKPTISSTKKDDDDDDDAPIRPKRKLIDDVVQPTTYMSPPPIPMSPSERSSAPQQQTGPAWGSTNDQIKTSSVPAADTGDVSDQDISGGQAKRNRSDVVVISDEDDDSRTLPSPKRPASSGRATGFAHQNQLILDSDTNTGQTLRLSQNELDLAYFAAENGNSSIPANWLSNSLPFLNPGSVIRIARLNSARGSVRAGISEQNYQLYNFPLNNSYMLQIPRPGKGGGGGGGSRSSGDY
jgi:hypothetical protein